MNRNKINRPSKKNGGIDAIKRRYGMLFALPWIFGVALFVLAPMISYFYYSLADLTMTPEGISANFAGLKYYKYVFMEKPYYTNIFVESLSSLFTSLPIVVALSMILAVILNQKFRGRMAARAVFFLPVIIASGAVMSVVASFNMNSEMMASAGAAGGKQAAEYMEVIDFNALLLRLNLPENVNQLIAGYLANTFNLIWSCGVQILLFVAGLQTIPNQLYEAGKVEGITAWEEFWRITVPMMGRIIMLVVFYTMVELFIEKGSMIESALGEIKLLEYSKSAAMLWPYFGAVGAVIGIVMFLYNRFCLRKWE